MMDESGEGVGGHQAVSVIKWGRIFWEKTPVVPQIKKMTVIDNDIKVIKMCNWR